MEQIGQEMLGLQFIQMTFHAIQQLPCPFEIIQQGNRRDRHRRGNQTCGGDILDEIHGDLAVRKKMNPKVDTHPVVV